MKSLQAAARGALLLVLLVLAACGGEPTATPVPPPATATAPPAATAAPAQATNTAPAATATVPAPAATDTAAPPAPTLAARVTPTPKPGLIVGDIFTIPSLPATPVPTVVPLQASTASAPNGMPYGAELTEYWRLFYEARTITKPGDKFDLATVSNLTAQPYRDYTLTLLQQSQADIDAGKLQQVTYSGIAIEQVGRYGTDADGNPTFDVGIVRTQTQVRTDVKQAPQTLNLLFRMKRMDLGNGKVSWQAYDFLNPATGVYVSETLANQIPVSQVQTEAADFFQRFYTARTLTQPGGQFDFETTGQLTAGAYQDYTLPLLEQQQAQVDAGQILTVAYSGLKVQVVNWDPSASNHGGLATVSVTRTSHIGHPGKPEETQTATYQFRIHRHLGDDGKPFWLAVDFLSPITNKWVSESAGMSGPIPPAGHG